MERCKFCGKAVSSGIVYHSWCFESEFLNCAHVFCNTLCKLKEQFHGDEKLQAECEKKCPLIELLDMGIEREVENS